MGDERTDGTFLRDLVIRPAAMGDAGPVTDMLNVCSLETVGEREWAPHHLPIDWKSPFFDLCTDTRIIQSPDGRIVGFGQLWDQEPHVRLYGTAKVHPNFRGMGIGHQLSEWLDERSERAVQNAPPNTRVALFQHTVSTDEAGQTFLQAHGYQLVRHFRRMVIELDQPTPRPQIPDGITIRVMKPGIEEPAVLKVVIDAFRDQWGFVESPFEKELQDWMNWINNDPHHDPSLWFLAVDGDIIAGVSVCLPRTTGDPDKGWVDTLAVRRPWRRRGLGLALLHHTFHEMRRRGKKRVGLGVDGLSLTGATRLYERAGMHIKREYSNFEKVFRQGKDLATRSVQE